MFYFTIDHAQEPDFEEAAPVRGCVVKQLNKEIKLLGIWIGKNEYLINILFGRDESEYKY